jgi:hypothetical protein
MKSTIIAIALILSGALSMAQSTITYTFDRHGRLLTEHYESLYQVAFSYDKEGNLETKGVIDYSGNNLLPQALEATGIKVYPNPAERYVVVEVEGETQVSKVALTDMSGRRIREVQDGALPLRVELEDITSGIYLLNIQSGSRDVWMRIVKR